MAFITCKRIVKVYRVGDHELVALRGIDFEMEQGEMVAIIGPSGAGKSTLLNLLGGLDTPTAGSLIVGDHNLLDLKGRALANYRLRHVGFLWQKIDRNLFPNRSALRNVTLPMMLAGVPPWKRRKRARELLDAVGILDQAHKRPVQLSGGQQQRVAVAVALANNPALLLADEPTGALDRATAETVMDLIDELRKEYGLTILMATHDLELTRHADRVLTLRDGALGQELGKEEETPQFDTEGRLNLPHAVQKQLTEAPRISVEIRPEGVLLRPEIDEIDDTEAILQDMLPQDAPPKALNGRFRLFRRRKKHERTKAEV
ncbi:MAG: ABC transporter ATP-binding protein [Anaerolineae bacterium]|nr:ABC transporter ATP-binding protein [Anaerolineae bacterium]